MHLHPVKCPSCGTIMPTERFRAGKPWSCPSCFRQFQISRTVNSILGWGAIGVSLVFFFILGLRGIQLFIATIVMWLPVLLILMWVFDRVMPPPLEPYDQRQKRSMF
jgi:hypothetical protein